METHTLADLEGVLSGVVIHTPLFRKFAMQTHVVPDLNESVVHGIGPGVVDS